MAAATSLSKITAFVVSKDKPRRLLVFGHPLAGIQLPAGTVEPGEDAAAAAAREVFEETGLEVTSQGIVLDEQVRPFGPERAAMLETVATDEATFQHGHKVRVLGEDEASGSVRVREEIYDYNVSPPELLSTITGTVPVGSLADAVRRTFVLFVEEARSTERRRQKADGHTFEVFWTPLRPDVALFERQREWLASHYEVIRGSL
ncbi:MAG: NUDIX domain-containing protein [Persicimonas sp.]